MTFNISGKTTMFSLLTAAVLGVSTAALADKSAKPAKSCAACCMPNKTNQATKGAASKTTAAKSTAAKPAAAKSVAAKAATAAKAPVAKAPVIKTASKSAPVAGAGWIYREPGSPMPQSSVGKSVAVPVIRKAKDPRDGISVTLPPMAASVAATASDGHANCKCQSGAGH